ncbi:menH [Symbiodinium natans]|uniref:MenH protein n=1 Tax=Symbiodinium natans TaxID=878477 RepID=A0A812PHN5_9DINO|nr:menH [Symbiodinium natans]
MPFATHDGVKIYYEDSGGEGPVLFMTHGFSGTGETWDAQLALSKEFRLIRWDMRGHGRSDSPESSEVYSKQHQLKDMESVLDACGVTSAIFVGHSLGGFDSLLFLLSSPSRAARVRALVLISTGPGFAKAESRQRWNSRAEVLAAEFTAKGRDALPKTDRNKSHTDHGARVGLANSAKYIFAQLEQDPLLSTMPHGAATVAQRLDEVKVPTLVLIGEQDKSFHAAAQMMAKKVANAKLVMVPGGGHSLQESHGAAVTAALRDFCADSHSVFALHATNFKKGRSCGSSTVKRPSDMDKSSTLPDVMGAQPESFTGVEEHPSHKRAAADSAAAKRLLDRAFEALQPALAPSLRQMHELAGGAVSHADEAYFRGLVFRELDRLALAEYLPAEEVLPRLMDVIGRACNVTFRSLPKPSWWQTGWHSGMRSFEVVDAPPIGAAAGSSGQRLGFAYVELFVPKFGSRPLAPHCMHLAPGHVYVGLHFQAPSFGKTKLLMPEDAITAAHELGHAVHMLCTRASCLQFRGFPLDLVELPSTFAEVLATQPSMVAEYARHHASRGPPPESLARSVQHGPYFFAQKLQSLSVSLTLHSPDFDAASATAEELRQRSIDLWQRYSAIPADPSFVPLAGDAGGYLAIGASQTAYLLCYMRSELFLHGGKGTGQREAAQRWLSPEFAGSLRSQLLDRAWPDRSALWDRSQHGHSGKEIPPHPLPPLPDASQFSLFDRLRRQMSPKKA